MSCGTSSTTCRYRDRSRAAASGRRDVGASPVFPCYGVRFVRCRPGRHAIECVGSRKLSCPLERGAVGVWRCGCSRSGWHRWRSGRPPNRFPGRIPRRTGHKKSAEGFPSSNGSPSAAGRTTTRGARWCRNGRGSHTQILALLIETPTAASRGGMPARLVVYTRL